MLQLDCKLMPNTYVQSQRVFRYSDNFARILYAMSVVAAIAAGTALPIMDIIFGKFVTSEPHIHHAFSLPY